MKTNDDYQFIAKIDEVKQTGLFVKGAIIIYYAEDKFYCFSKRCPHMPDIGDLSLGEFCPIKKTVKCHKHPITYDLASGTPIKETHKRIAGALNFYDILVLGEDLYIKVKQNETVEVLSC